MHIEISQYAFSTLPIWAMGAMCRCGDDFRLRCWMEDLMFEEFRRIRETIRCTGLGLAALDGYMTPHDFS